MRVISGNLRCLLLFAFTSCLVPTSAWASKTELSVSPSDTTTRFTESKPYVRWWWLGSAVDREGLDFNLSEFARKGIGGVEITPIYGVKGNEKNDLDFLSPEWMDAYAYTVRRGKELGVQVDMSNCTGWPFGGPWVSTDDSAQKYILETLTLGSGERLNEPLSPSDDKQKAVATIEALQAVSDSGERLDLINYVNADGRLDWTAPSGSWTLYALYAGRTFQKVKRAAPGGVGYVLNHYNRDAVERYLAHFDEAFRRSNAPWPDTFFNDSFEVYGSNWDHTLLAEFERTHGYRLQDYLPEFAAQGADDKSMRVIRDYRQTLSDMLLRNFTKVWTDWAHAHGSRVRNQAHGSPGNIFDLYATVDIPECESFGRTRFNIPGLRDDPDAKPSDADPAVLKFASSASHVMGKRLTSSETLTWLTEHFRTSLATCKPEIDQVLASGVNHIYFHGAPYSPFGVTFPGWLFYASINMSPTAPLWTDAGAMFDYITRCQSFLQDGKPNNDLLLYIPIEDIGASQRDRNFFLFEIHKMDKIMPGLKQTMNNIVRGGYDADYISDLYLSDTKVVDGQIVTTGGTRYKALVMPDCQLLTNATLSKALELARSGATIVFKGRYPDDVPGLSDLEKRRLDFRQLVAQLPEADFSKTETHHFGAGRIITGNDLDDLMRASGAVFESLKLKGCQLTRRETEEGYHYFVSLLGDKPIDEWVELGVEARKVIITDPLTGYQGLADSRITINGTTELRLRLQPGQSLLLDCLNSTSQLARMPRWPYYVSAGDAVLGHDWKLDFPSSMPAVANSFNLDKPQSWTEIADNESEQVRYDLTRLCGTGRYTATFTVKKPKKADAWILHLGDVRESARVRVNGRDAGVAWSVPFELDVTEYLVAGDNLVEIEVTNLPANYIVDLDKRGVEWRIFKDANIVSASGQPLDTSSWPIEPSGLCSDVWLCPYKK